MAHVAASLVLLTSATCSRGPAPPTRAERLVVGTTEPANTLDPATCYEYLCSRMLLANTHEGLVRFAPGTTTIAPSLAASWVVSADGLTYTFTLRPNVTFHDGSPVTAEAVKRSLDRVRALSTNDTAGFLLFDPGDPPRSGIVAVDAPSPQTVVIRLAKRDASFLTKLEFPVSSIVPAGPYPAAGAAGPGVVVGTGPYRLDVNGFRRGQSIDLVRFDAYWGDKPETRRVRIRLLGSSSELAAAAAASEVDVALRSLEPPDAQSLRSAPGVSTSSAPGAVVRFLAFNVRRAPFHALDVRRAAAAAVDRGTITGAVLRGTADPLLSLVPSGLDAHRDPFRDLKAAGPPSTRTAFDLWYTPSHYGTSEAEVAEALKRTLESSGSFAVTLRSAEWPDFKAALARGDLAAYLLGWFPDYVDAQDYLEPFLGTAGAAAVGSNYSNGDVDALLAEASATADPARRTAIFVALQHRLASDVPYVPLWQPRQIAFLARGVAGLRLDMSQAVRLADVAKTVAS